MIATLEWMVGLGSLSGQDGVRRHMWESSHDCEIVAWSGRVGAGAFDITRLSPRKGFANDI